MKKRILSLILTITMFISFAGLTVNAATAEIDEQISWLNIRIYEDLNYNKLCDEGEAIPAAFVNILDSVSREVKYTVKADDYGSWYCELKGGNYICQTILPEGYEYYSGQVLDYMVSEPIAAERTEACTLEFPYTIQPSMQASIDIIVEKLPSELISGYVWNDVNKNRQMYSETSAGIEEGESGIPGAVITVSDKAGKVIATKETEELGNFYFELVPPLESYIFEITMPEKYSDYNPVTPEDKKREVYVENMGNGTMANFFFAEGELQASPTPEASTSPSPSVQPTEAPTTSSVSSPTPEPTEEPEFSLTPEPTEKPAFSPTPEPTKMPELNKTEHYAYVLGYPEGLIKPESNISRQEVATIFFRLLTDDTRDIFYAKSNKFEDVTSDMWSNIAISTMTQARIITGYDEKSFKPANNITRAEFATIAAKFDSGTYLGPNKFNDIDGHWASEYINRAAERGWISGYEDGSFKPDAYITRAEAMTLINNVLERHVTPEGMVPDMATWPDNTPDKWYYTPVQEAANSHYYEKNGDYETWTELRETRDWTELEK
ncbi:MAG: S-layer homology domain-containing protein [Clostridia bacterium]